MTIESSGTLGLNGTCTGGSSARNQSGAELGKTAATTLCMNNSCLRSLSGTSSSTQLSFSTFYGKANTVTINYLVVAGAGAGGYGVSSEYGQAGGGGGAGG